MISQSTRTGGFRVEQVGEAGFAVAVLLILAILFTPLPAAIIDIGLALSIGLSVVILMVALWLNKPLEFSAFPTVLLVVTMLRLALNIATTRLILQHGAEGPDAAGHVIAGFANMLMGGDFVIGCVVFVILVIVNFVVITKGATRIAEVGARFSLDAMPGKQMAIDADLSAGSIDERTANKRRQELEEESAFFGAMDGASKFVRGDAIAGLAITAVNILGGILVGVLRHGMPVDQAVDVFMRLSVGDGLVTQIPALIVSLAAGLLVSKGGTRGPAQQAVVHQLGLYPPALYVTSCVMGLLALTPGLPTIPFLIMSGLLAWTGMRSAASAEKELAPEGAVHLPSATDAPTLPSLAVEPAHALEIVMGRPLAGHMMRPTEGLLVRMSRLRKKFAMRYGVSIPDVHLTDSLDLPSYDYVVRIHGAAIARGTLRLGELLVVLGDAAAPDIPGEEVREPAFSSRAMWFPDSYAAELTLQGFQTVDATSVLLTHVAELVRIHLANLLSYRALRALVDDQDQSYKKLLDDLIPSHLTFSSFQGVLKLLLQEQVSIRALPLIIESVAEIAPFTRKIEGIAEHVRARLAQQICADTAQDGVLKVVRVGAKWETLIRSALKRDARGEVTEFDIDPRDLEAFGNCLSETLRGHIDEGHDVCLVCSGLARPYVRMILERIHPTISVLAHGEVVRNVQIQHLGTI